MNNLNGTVNWNEFKKEYELLNDMNDKKILFLTALSFDKYNANLGEHNIITSVSALLQKMNLYDFDDLVKQIIDNKSICDILNEMLIADKELFYATENNTNVQGLMASLLKLQLYAILRLLKTRPVQNNESPKIKNFTNDLLKIFNKKIESVNELQTYDLMDRYNENKVFESISNDDINNVVINSKVENVPIAIIHDTYDAPVLHNNINVINRGVLLPNIAQKVNTHEFEPISNDDINNIMVNSKVENIPTAISHDVKNNTHDAPILHNNINVINKGVLLPNVAQEINIPKKQVLKYNDKINTNQMKESRISEIDNKKIKDGLENQMEKSKIGEINEQKMKEELQNAKNTLKQQLEEDLKNANKRLEKERLEKERLEKERLEKERLEKERLEKERLEKERLEEQQKIEIRKQIEKENDELMKQKLDAEEKMEKILKERHNIHTELEKEKSDRNQLKKLQDLTIDEDDKYSIKQKEIDKKREELDKKDKSEKNGIIKNKNIIILIGTTRSGKSTLISNLRSKEDKIYYAPMGSIFSATKDITKYTEQFGDKEFIIIDTPGLGDTSRKGESSLTDEDILNNIFEEIDLYKDPSNHIFVMFTCTIVAGLHQIDVVNLKKYHTYVFDKFEGLNIKYAFVLTRVEDYDNEQIIESISQLNQYKPMADLINKYKYELLASGSMNEVDISINDTDSNEFKKDRITAYIKKIKLFLGIN